MIVQSFAIVAIFGNCLNYAVAKLAGQSLLFVGNDFSQKDLEAA